MKSNNNVYRMPFFYTDKRKYYHSLKWGKVLQDENSKRNYSELTIIVEDKIEKYINFYLFKIKYSKYVLCGEHKSKMYNSQLNSFVEEAIKNILYIYLDRKNFIDERVSSYISKHKGYVGRLNDAEYKELLRNDKIKNVLKDDKL